MDLLTVVMHELGHLFGYGHDEDGVMAQSLAEGMRRTGLEHDDVALADDVFGQADGDVVLHGAVVDLESSDCRLARRF